MAGTRRVKRVKADDLVFEGVVIPRRTRSAKIAALGITDEEDMGRFLTAIFCDTLSGKIVLPKPGAPARVPLRNVNAAGQKLKRGLPVSIQPLRAKGKNTRRAKAKVGLAG
jgi:hypothetical protein